MPAGDSPFSRISRSIQGRVSKSAADDPDGALAKYLWLWKSMGRRPGRRLIPRPIRFFFVASLDLFSLVGWFIRTGVLRVVRSARSKEAIMNLARSKRVAGLTIVAGGVIGASLSISFLGSGDVPAPDPVVVLAPDPVVVPSVPAEETASSGQASGFDLQQNYPNPFNPETTIPFILHEGLFTEGRPAQVSMRIFNVLTEEVASPVALGHSSGEGVELIELEYTQPGTYEAFWDGTDRSGREVDSGIYFVQLKVNGRLELRRLYRSL